MGWIIVLIVVGIIIYFIYIKGKKLTISHKKRVSKPNKIEKEISVDISLRRGKPLSFKDMPVGGIKHTIYNCYLEGKSPKEIHNDPKLSEWSSQGKRYDRMNYIEYVGKKMIEEGIIDSIKKDSKIDKAFKPIGNIDPICPHCDFTFEKKPGRKKKCPNCCEFIYVRTRPYDQEKVLVTENQEKQIEEQWNRYHKE